MASLNTFGAILTYAIALEENLSAYYEKIGKADRAKDAGKRHKKLLRVRRENVLEITLEPIDGLDESNYTFDFDDTSEAGQQANEEHAVAFYQDVAPKINVRQAQRSLEKCGKQHAALV